MFKTRIYINKEFFHDGEIEDCVQSCENIKNHTTGGTVLLQNNTKYDVIFKAHISSSRLIVNEMRINYKIAIKQIRLLRPLMLFVHNSA